MRVLVTGGSGYIGSHTCVQLLQNGHDVIILDNLCNSKRSVLPVIERLGGKHPTFVEGDIRNEALMTEILHDHAIDTVIHFAGLKAVGESVQKPLEYYDNNVNGTLRLISAMRAANVKNFIFSSSATVYGDQPKIPYVESFPTGTPQSPYGKSKLMVEQILTDLQKAQPDWSIALLRYFNPVGAHPSGDMGEDPQGIPNNLMPYIAQVAVGRRDSLAIFGNDYPTEDGTGVRDYIHVMDLADGHVVAMEKLANKPGVHIYNLGAGVGSSVLDVVNAFSKACGKPVNYHFAPRREGMVVLLAIAFLLSVNKKKISLRTVGAGLVLQVVIGGIMLWLPPGRWVAEKVAFGVHKVMAYSDAGSAFIFGSLAMIRPIKKTRLVNNSSITAAELAAYQATNAVSNKPTVIQP